ncbi:hypothetical protein ScPMuIL_011970 [Solemya velum]
MRVSFFGQHKLNPFLCLVRTALLNMSDETKRSSSAKESVDGDGAAGRKEEVIEKNGDLFECPETEALAHCISEDVRMGAGIAVIFKKKFGGVEELKEQGKRPGEVAVLKRGERFVYYLVTKEKYNHKPTLPTLEHSLQAMKKHCVKNDVKSLSMPQIGCGLDGLQWDKVLQIIKKVFWKSCIQVTIYTLPKKNTQKNTITSYLQQKKIKLNDD